MSRTHQLPIQDAITRPAHPLDPIALDSDTTAAVLPDAPHELCPHCRGVGWLGSDVPLGHPQFGVLIACACTRAAQARKRAAELWQLSNLALFPDQTFSTFNPFVAGLRSVVSKALAYANLPSGWLTLIGPYGVGKTHLAAAIAHEALNRGIPTVFVVVPDLLDHLRTTFAPHSTVSYDQHFELVRSVDLLILDDLGTESATPWAREKLYQLLNHRYNLRAATVITTNLKPSAIDPRIYSRMCDHAIGSVIEVTAHDYRRRSHPSSRERSPDATD